MADRYWIANLEANQLWATAGNWADNADGSGANTVPVANDNVHFGHATTLAAGKGFGSCELGGATATLAKFTSYEGYNQVQTVNNFTILASGYFAPNPVAAFSLEEIGFRAGMVITVTGAANAGNNSTFEIQSIVGNLIQVTASGSMVDESTAVELTITYDPSLDLKGQQLNMTSPAGGTLMTLNSKIKNTTGTGGINFLGALVGGAGNRYFLCGDNQTIENRDSILMQFTPTGAMYFDDGIYPIVQLNAGTYSCDYAVPTSAEHQGVHFYKFKESVATTWSSGAGSKRDNIRKIFYVENITSFVLLTTNFDTGQSTWSFDTDNNFVIPTSGDFTNYPSGFTVRWYNLIIKNSGGNAGIKSTIPARRNLQVNSLTVEANANVEGEKAQSATATAHKGSSTITSVNRPTIKGSWNFSQVADGVYASLLTESYSITPSHGSRGALQFSYDGGAFHSQRKMNLVLDNWTNDWTTANAYLLLSDGAFISSSFYEFCKTYTVGAGAGNNRIWISDASPSVPYFTDSNGAEHSLLAGGGGGGSMSSWTLSGDSGANQSITDGNTVDIAGGTGISTEAGTATDTVTITNTGVTSNVAGTGISVSGATGAVTIGNTGVTSNVAGTGITVSGATGAVTIGCDLEGTELKSTGETGGSKFLREDGDGTCSWQTVSGGGGGGVIVQNEGVALATTATTLNFVDEGVVASGSGATKTITIGANTEVIEWVNSNTTIGMKTTIAVCASATDCTAKAGVVGVAWSGMSDFGGELEDYDFTASSSVFGGAQKGLVDVPVPTIGRKLTLVIPYPCDGRSLPQGISQITCTGQAGAFIGHDLAGMVNGSNGGKATTGSIVLLPETYLRGVWNDAGRSFNTSGYLGHHAITLVGVPAPTGSDASLAIPDGATMGDVVDTAKWWVETNNEFLWDSTDRTNAPTGYFDDRTWGGLAWGQLYVVC